MLWAEVHPYCNTMPDAVPKEPSTALFRVEAIDAIAKRGYGPIVLARPVAMRNYTVLFSLVGLAILCFFFFATYQRKVHVSGVLLPTSGLIQITAPQAGVIEQQSVVEGSAVKAGSPLFEVVTDRTNASGGNAAALISELLNHRVESFSGEQKEIHAQSHARIQAAMARATGLEGDATRIGEEMELQEKRIRLAQDAFSRFEDLGRQHFASAAQVQDKQTALLEQEQRLADLARAQAGSRRDAASARAEAEDDKLQEGRENRDIVRAVDSLHQDQTENEARSHITIASPSNGTLMSLRSTKGQSVQSGEVIAVVIPEGSSLDAELYVPSKAAGFLKPDMDVLISYRSYPSEKFGLNHGMVREISGVAMRPNDMLIPEVAVLDDGSHEPVYRVRVSLDQQNIRVDGAQQTLRPGMLLDARIPLERRRIYQWALDPLFAIAGKI